jgi:transposase
MHLERNKSDKKDAKWLYFYAQQRETSPWCLPPKEQLYCAQIMGSIDLYRQQLVMITNQLHSLEQIPMQMKEVVKSLQSMKQLVEKEIKKLEKSLHLQLVSWQREQLQNITSILGLGKRAVALLIIYTDGFKKISNHRQLIALAGLAPREHTSGTSIKGKKGICKMVNGHLRNVLHMCSLSAIKHNQACKEFDERLKAEGKQSKVALIAVCNKLLKQAFAIATKGTTYQPGYKSTLH